MNRAKTFAPAAASVQSPRRSRLRYVGLILLTVLVGLASRHPDVPLPAFVQAYAGDVLWVLLVFWLIGFAFVRRPGRWVAGWALAFAFGIEISQLWHPAWLEALRHTTLGALVLGFSFLWSDLLCYTVGILAGWALETAWCRWASAKMKIIEPS